MINILLGGVLIYIICSLSACAFNTFLNPFLMLTLCVG